LASYTAPQLRQLIRTSIAILRQHGFARPRSFRAGAWQAEGRTFNALTAEGLTLDASATYAEYLKVRWGHSLLYPTVAKIWSHIGPTSQPYVIPTSSGRLLWELPNNGCLADYVTAEDMLATYRANAALWRDHPQRDVYLSIGFHQETAHKYLNRLRDAIDLIRAAATADAVPIEFFVPRGSLPLPPLASVQLTQR
jgi:hypothetical protein